MSFSSKLRFFSPRIFSAAVVYQNTKLTFQSCCRQRCLNLYKKCTSKCDCTPSKKHRLAVASMSLAVATRSFLWFGKKEEESDKVLTLIKKAKLKEHSLEFPEAEGFYHDALKLAADGVRANKITEKEYLNTLNHCYSSLADISTAHGKLQDAEKLYKESMKVLLQLGIEQTDNAIIELSVKLSSIFGMQQKLKDAETGFLFCIKTQEEKMKDTSEIDENTSAILGLALETYGRFVMYTKKDYAKSEDLFSRSLKIAENVLGEEHPQTLNIMNDLTTVLIFQKKYDEAEKLLSNAIKLGVKTDAPELPALYSNLGAVYLRKSSLDEAYMACGNASHYAKKFKDMTGFQQAQKCLEKVEKVKSQQRKN